MNESANLPPMPSPSEPTEEQPSAGAAKRPFPPAWAVFVVLVGIVIVGAAFVGMFLTSQRERSTGGAESIDISKLSTFNSPPDIPEGIAVLQENGSPLAAILPTTLDIRDQSFPVVPVISEEGRWPVPGEQQDVAVWVYGTVVNYVVGIPYTSTTESLLGSLASTDRITLSLSNGTALVFGSPQAQRYLIDDTSALTQQSPGLTLVLLGNQDLDRLVVSARYLPEEGGTTGGTQQIDGVQVAFLDARVVSEGSGDIRNFVVDYRVINEGQGPVDPVLFDAVLEDGQGQRYAVNAEVTAMGTAGPLTALVEPGSSAEGSAGYQVPRSMKAPITWIFRPDPTSPEGARFSVPYQPPLPLPAQPQVELTQAFADAARGVIVINGVVRNSGESALVVTLDNVKLTSSAGTSELRNSSPVLPWTIAGGAEQAFEAQFSRPEDVTSVLLDVLGFTFQIEGLP